MRLSIVLLILILLGPPVLRLGREASTVFENPYEGLNATYLLHLGVWGIAGLQVVFALVASRRFLAWLVGYLRVVPIAWYVVFAAWALSSSLWSLHRLYTVFFAYKLAVAILLAALVAYEASIRNRSPAKELMKSVALAYGLGFVMLSFLLLTAPNLVTRPSRGLLGFRVTGGFLGDYGTYALFTFIAFLGLYASHKRTALVRLLEPVVLAWPVLLLVLAQTRSKLAAFVFIVLLHILYGFSPVRRFLWSAGLILLSLVGGVFGGAMLIEFLRRGQDIEEIVSLSGRSLLFEYLLQYWRMSPLHGLGFQAGSRYAAVRFVEATGINMGAAHDMMSKVLVDLGLVGALVLLAACASATLRLVRLRRRLNRHVWLFLVSILVYGSVASFVSGGFADAQPLWACFFFAITIARVEVMRSGKSTSNAYPLSNTRR